MLLGDLSVTGGRPDFGHCKQMPIELVIECRKLCNDIDAISDFPLEDYYVYKDQVCLECSYHECECDPDFEVKGFTPEQVTVMDAEAAGAEVRDTLYEGRCEVCKWSVKHCQCPKDNIAAQVLTPQSVSACKDCGYANCQCIEPTLDIDVNANVLDARNRRRTVEEQLTIYEQLAGLDLSHLDGPNNPEVLEGEPTPLQTTTEATLQRLEVERLARMREDDHAASLNDHELHVRLAAQWRKTYRP